MEEEKKAKGKYRKNNNIKSNFLTSAKIFVGNFFYAYWIQSSNQFFPDTPIQQNCELFI